MEYYIVLISNHPKKHIGTEIERAVLCTCNNVHVLDGWGVCIMISRIFR